MSQRTKWILGILSFLVAVTVAVGGYFIVTGKWKIGAAEFQGSAIQFANPDGEPFVRGTGGLFTLNTGQETSLIAYSDETCPNDPALGYWAKEGGYDPNVTIPEIGPMAAYGQTGGCSVEFKVKNDSTISGQYFFYLVFTGQGGRITDAKLQQALITGGLTTQLSLYRGGSAPTTPAAFYQPATTSFIHDGFVKPGAKVNFKVWGGMGPIIPRLNEGVMDATTGKCVNGTEIQVSNITKVNDPNYRPQIFEITAPDATKQGCNDNKYFGYGVATPLLRRYHPLTINSADGVEQKAQVPTIISTVSANKTATYEVSATELRTLTACGDCLDTMGVIVTGGSISPTGGTIALNKYGQTGAPDQPVAPATAVFKTTVAGSFETLHTNLTSGGAVIATPLLFSNQPGDGGGGSGGGGTTGCGASDIKYAFTPNAWNIKTNNFTPKTSSSKLSDYFNGFMGTLAARTYSYPGTGKSYVNNPAISSVLPGVGYWLTSGAQSPVCLDSSKATASNTTSVTIASSLAMVGNPTGQSVKMSDIYITINGKKMSLVDASNQSPAAVKGIFTYKPGANSYGAYYAKVYSSYIAGGGQEIGALKDVALEPGDGFWIIINSKIPSAVISF